MLKLDDIRVGSRILGVTASKFVTAVQRLLGDTTENLLLMTAIPYNGKPEDFQWFLSLVSVAQSDSSKNLESIILELIQANPTTTANRLAEETGKSRRQVLRILASMQDSGKLERIGPNRGRWHVLA